MDHQAEFMADARPSELPPIVLAMLYYKSLPTRLQACITELGQPTNFQELAAKAIQYDHVYWEN